jgi:hypothetical protein
LKNLSRDMPERVVREELESLNIRVHGVMHLQSGLREQDNPPAVYPCGEGRDDVPTSQLYTCLDGKVIE